MDATLKKFAKGYILQKAITGHRHELGDRHKSIQIEPRTRDVSKRSPQAGRQIVLKPLAI